MSNTTIVYPDYIRLVERKAGGWCIKKGEMFYKRLEIELDFQDFDLLYGISKQQLAVALFRLHGGKAGYYLANLRDKQYFYCGLQAEDVKTTLLRLGIGRPDPHENSV